MLKTYFTIAYRNFIRNKIFSLINVLGLSIGISSALVIFLIVQYDYTFDRFEKDSDRIYRVVTTMTFSGTPMHFSGVASPLAEAVRTEGSGVEETVGFLLQNHGCLPDQIPSYFHSPEPLSFLDFGCGH